MSRDYLYIREIDDVLSNIIGPNLHEILMEAINEEAGRCLCHARSSSECTCGAWDDNDDS